MTHSKRKLITPQEATRLTSRLRREFAYGLAGALCFPAGVRQRPHPPITYWLDPAWQLNHARLDAFMEPGSGALDLPLIMRVSINYYAVDYQDRLRQRMGWPPTVADWYTHDLHWSYELSLLPGQVLDFVPWIAALAEAKVHRDVTMIPEPPHPCHFWGGQRIHCMYAWSRAAWKRIEPIQKARREEWRRRHHDLR